MAALFSLFMASGCATITGDPVLVRAEQFIDSTMVTIDSFLQFEAENRAIINDEGCKEFANKLRKDVPEAFETYNRILEAYESNRTPENKLKLEGAVELFETLRKETLYWVGKHSKKTATPGSFELVMLAMAGIGNLIKLISEYRRVSAQSEEWTEKEKKLFRDKWQRIMDEASHWKIE